MTSKQGHTPGPGCCCDRAEHYRGLWQKAQQDRDALLAACEYVVNCIPEPGEDAILDAEGYNRLCAALALARGTP